MAQVKIGFEILDTALKIIHWGAQTLVSQVSIRESKKGTHKSLYCFVRTQVNRHHTLVDLRRSL